MEGTTTNNNVAMKTCQRCGRILPVTNFHTNAKAHDGLQPYCKECKREYDRSRKEVLRAKQEEAKKELARMASNTDTIKLKDGTVLRKVVKDFGNPLEQFTSRELLAEIKRRGYKWEKMTIVQEIEYNKI